MRQLCLFSLPIISILLQSTIFSFFNIYDAMPDLVLITVVFFALLHRSKEASVYGFLCGLFEDLYIGDTIGMNAIAKGTVAFVISHLQGQVFKENILVGIIGTFIGTLLNAFLVVIIYSLAGKGMAYDSSLVIRCGFQIIYNVVISSLFYLSYFNSTHNGWLRKIRREL